MENNIQQQIEERIAELPEDIQAAIASSDVDEKIRLIGQAHNLHIDQMEALNDEIMMGMLGFINLDDLPHGIEERVRVTSQEAQAITDAANQEIFHSIRESMKAWAARKHSDAAAVPAHTAPVPPPIPSVVMPSSPKPLVPVPAPIAPAPAPVPTPIAVAPAPSTPPAPAHNLVAADAILSEKKVAPPATPPTTTPAAPAPSPTVQTDPTQPQNYKADPYREPVE